MLYPLHRFIVWLIRRLPPRLGLLAFRAYNRLLRAFSSDYIATTYFGAKLHCDPRDLIQRTILHFGVWEPDVSHTVENNLAKGQVFVDIGANIGYDTLLASRIVGDAGKVVAIEASPRTFALLQRNLALNNASNVRAVNAAASNRRGKLELYETSIYNIGAATTLPTRGGTPIGTVDALPLDELLTEQERARVRLVKMDVEGAEPTVLGNLLDRLALYPATMDILVEASFHDSADVWRGLLDRMLAAGFAAYAIENAYELEWYLAWRQVTPLRRIAKVPTDQIDLLFTRRAGG